MTTAIARCSTPFAAPDTGLAPIDPASAGGGFEWSRLIPATWRTTTARIGMIVFAALVLTSALLLIVISRLTHDELYADARIGVAQERDAIVADMARYGLPATITAIADNARLPGTSVILLTAANGHPIAGNLDAWPAGLGTGRSFANIELRRSGQGAIEPFGVTTVALDGGYRLLVARSLATEERLAASLRAGLFGAVGLAFALALVTSFILARVISARVQNIADVAKAVAGGDLGRRVDEAAGDRGDAFDAMAHALNTMLARIEALLGEIRMVTDGLAHDLRSPLTRLRARIDRLARGEGELPDEIAAIGMEADALLVMLENSLELSRIEAGIGRDAFDCLDATALVNDLADMYEPLADEQGVSLRGSTAGPLIVSGHRNLLSRALANLIDNALRYGSSGGRIEVSATATDTGIALSVADNGAGIPAGRHDEALRRFGRIDPARPGGGAGLGLSLAAAIARLHGGELTLHDNGPGLRVMITLPRSDVPARAAA